MFNLAHPPEEPRRILLVDVSELVYRLRADHQFAMVAKYIPEVYLFDTCHDFDEFYQLLSDLRSNDQHVAEELNLVMTDAIYDEVEYQGSNFVQLYRDAYILPAVNAVNAKSTYRVGGMTTSQQVMISY